MRGLAVALAAGLFLTFSGAFGTDDAPLPARLIYWMTLMVVGYLWGALVVRFFLRDRRRTGKIWIDAGISALVMSVPLTLLVWAATRFMFNSNVPFSGIWVLFGPVLLVSLALTSINMLIETRRDALTAAGPNPPKFLERLPLKLRGAEVWAVEAEDHYLRLHTSKGQDLILLRLADAVAELEGIEGAQVHRSWWVARDAIADAKRGDGRATLTLKDGAEVPVSRTYAGLLRERGWI
ncbi:MAG: LytTR family transcriptional regulator DNA-binding domain-containing protein [Alphaproteobacteria bacterium]|nr:LytTR family transcriptional regulator DNA-binding domain-containing protein [Alphaproteobacteria bacterium]MBU1514235.1 LytTR family transcriptional regulator DNA-binding domain-containing protein [Alphaproteobacteria bacterium]MBU2093319.1 LytTR family transcriptional regulator DNA-binding domain-containing protein [Alphaproteobacteria bacterium]MBU2153410.1 LytTR family transcriptional regulator DNA-binding domain-containing protein [Alphaproteobacteria bacterium]MBU2307101.1 LytTR family